MEYYREYLQQYGVGCSCELRDAKGNDRSDAEVFARLLGFSDSDAKRQPRGLGEFDDAMLHAGFASERERVPVDGDDGESGGFKESITLVFKTEGTEEVKREIREIEEAVDRLNRKPCVVGRGFPPAGFYPAPWTYTVTCTNESGD